MPQLTFINLRKVDLTINPLQALTYCIIGILLMSAVFVAQVNLDNPARMSGEIAGSETGMPEDSAFNG